MFKPKYGDVTVTLDGNVTTLEIHRPPHNFFDFNLIHDLADAFEALDETAECRALMLCSEGKSFCAGANFANRDAQSGEAPSRAGENPLYVEGVRLFRCKKPVVAAIQGAAIGGGLRTRSRRRLPRGDGRGPLRRELRQDRHPPRLRPHLHAPAPDRHAKGQP